MSDWAIPPVPTNTWDPSEHEGFEDADCPGARWLLDHSVVVGTESRPLTSVGSPMPLINALHRLEKLLR